MQCGACNKSITEGEYRVYQKTGKHDWWYVTHHRACCADDPKWAKKDAADQKRQHTLDQIDAAVQDLFRRFPPEYHGIIAEEVQDYWTGADQ